MDQKPKQASLLARSRPHCLQAVLPQQWHRLALLQASEVLPQLVQSLDHQAAQTGHLHCRVNRRRAGAVAKASTAWQHTRASCQAALAGSAHHRFHQHAQRVALLFRRHVHLQLHALARPITQSSVRSHSQWRLHPVLEAQQHRSVAVNDSSRLHARSLSCSALRCCCTLSSSSHRVYCSLDRSHQQCHCMPRRLTRRVDYFLELMPARCQQTVQPQHGMRVCEVHTEAHQAPLQSTFLDEARHPLILAGVSQLLAQ